MRNVVGTSVIACFAILSSCKTAPPVNEEVREQRAKTVYRAADEATRNEPPVIAPRQKVPGE